MNLHPNVVFLLVAAAVLWLAARGRLAKLVAAFEGGGSPLQPSDSGQGAPGSGATSVHPGKHPFGLSKVTSSFSQTGWLQADRGLMPDLAGEWNYMLPYGAHEPVFLPDRGTGWTEEKQGQLGAGGGGYELWKKGKAEIAFLHLSDLWDPTAGTGGVVGTTGAPTPGSAYSAQPAGADIKANEHLAVVYNQAAKHYLN